MGAITTGEVVLKLRLDTKDALAEYNRFLASAKGGAVGLGVGGGGGTVPHGVGAFGGGGGGGAPGGGFLQGALGGMSAGGMALGLVGGAAAAVGGAFLAPGALDIAKGVFGRVGQAGSDVAESLGLGAFARGADVPHKTADATVSMLKYAGASMSSEQIKAVGAMNRGLAELETASENKVRETLGTERVTDFFERMVNVLESIDRKTPATNGMSQPNIGSR